MEINRFLNQEVVVFKEGFSSSDFGAILEGLKANGTIKKLTLHKSLLAELFPIISKGLQLNNKLTSLDLSENALGVEEAKLVSDVIRTNNCLERINLESNNIGPVGVGYIVEALKVNTKLQSISLERNKIGDNGAKSISELISSNTPLTNINIRFNQISPVGTESIFESLKSNSTLRSLDVSWNKIGQSGVKKLGEALKENSTLVSMDITRCQIDVDGSSILEALKANTTLAELHFEGTFADKTQCDTLSEVWESTKKARSSAPTSPVTSLPPPGPSRNETPVRAPFTPFKSSHYPTSTTETQDNDLEPQEIDESEEIGFLNRMDVRQEKLNHIGPIENVINLQPKNLDQSLSSLGPHLNSQKIISLLFAEDLILNENFFNEDESELHDSNGLNKEEIAAINLYTRDWDDPIYTLLNFYLRNEKRSLLKPYLPYLRLLVSGLSKLPLEERTLWRDGKGVNIAKYKTGRKLFWWGFSSCAPDNSLFDDHFFEAVEDKILFQIESISAVCIQKYSVSLSAEYILLPGSFFEVLGTEISGGRTIIHLRELQRPLSIFE